MKAKDYAEKARIWAHGIRLVDPNVKLVSCGREVSSQLLLRERVAYDREMMSGIASSWMFWRT